MKSSETAYPLRVGPYMIEGRVGQGGMATVLLARTEEHQRPVALKVIRAFGVEQEQQMRRFRREIHALYKLNHPCLVGIRDAGFDGEWFYYAMEHMEGGTLRGELDQTPQMPFEKAFPMMRGLTHAAAYLHRNRIIHRDIKPSNVLVAKDGTAKLSDLGLLRFHEETDLTQSGQIIGTIRYMSPEMLDKSATSFTSDIYQLGLLYFEMLAGRAVIEKARPHQMVALILTQETPRVSAFRADVDPLIDDLIARCLERDPAGRPQDGSELYHELDRILKAIEARPAPGEDDDSIVFLSEDDLSWSVPVAAEPPVEPVRGPVEAGETPPQEVAEESVPMRGAPDEAASQQPEERPAEPAPGPPGDPPVAVEPQAPDRRSRERPALTAEAPQAADRRSRERPVLTAEAPQAADRRSRERPVLTAEDPQAADRRSRERPALTPESLQAADRGSRERPALTAESLKAAHRTSPERPALPAEAPQAAHRGSREQPALTADSLQAADRGTREQPALTADSLQAADRGTRERPALTVESSDEDHDDFEPSDADSLIAAQPSIEMPALRLPDGTEPTDPVMPSMSRDELAQQAIARWGKSRETPAISVGETTSGTDSLAPPARGDGTPIPPKMTVPGPEVGRATPREGTPVPRRGPSPTPSEGTPVVDREPSPTPREGTPGVDPAPAPVVPINRRSNDHLRVPKPAPVPAPEPARSPDRRFEGILIGLLIVGIGFAAMRLSGRHEEPVAPGSLRLSHRRSPEAVDLRVRWTLEADRPSKLRVRFLTRKESEEAEREGKDPADVIGVRPEPGYLVEVTQSPGRTHDLSVQGPTEAVAAFVQIDCGPGTETWYHIDVAAVKADPEKDTKAAATTAPTPVVTPITPSTAVTEVTNPSPPPSAPAAAQWTNQAKSMPVPRIARTDLPAIPPPAVDREDQRSGVEILWKAPGLGPDDEILRPPAPLSPSGNYLAVADGKSVFIHDLKSGARVRRFDLIAGETPSFLALTRSDSLIVWSGDHIHALGAGDASAFVVPAPAPRTGDTPPLVDRIGSHLVRCERGTPGRFTITVQSILTGSTSWTSTGEGAALGWVTRTQEPDDFWLLFVGRVPGSSTPAVVAQRFHLALGPAAGQGASIELAALDAMPAMTPFPRIQASEHALALLLGRRFLAWRIDDWKKTHDEELSPRMTDPTLEASGDMALARGTKTGEPVLVAVVSDGATYHPEDGGSSWVTTGKHHLVVTGGWLFRYDITGVNIEATALIPWQQRRSSDPFLFLSGSSDPVLDTRAGLMKVRSP